MQRLKFSRLIAVLSLLLAAWVAVGAQTYSESQKITRTFSAGTDTRLDLTNKYGTVHVIPWNKDSVHIEIDLFIKSSSASKLEKLKRNVDFDFTDTRYYITATTVLGSKGGGFFSDLKDLGGTIIPSKNEVTIDYTVQVPAGININITNKYGDIYIDDMKGNVSVNLSNGDIKANALTGESNISLNFGNGILNELGNSKLNISYADLEIQKAGQLSIESKSSKIRIREADKLNTNSKRDKYSVTTLNSLSGESWFTDLWISKLNEEINHNPKYGALKVDSVSDQFSLINVNTEFTDINLVFNKSVSYQLEIMKHNNAMLRLPDEYAELEVIDEEEEAVHLRGMVGPAQSSTSKVKITAPKKCIINIQTR